jgi:hypothetical protein
MRSLRGLSYYLLLLFLLHEVTSTVLRSNQRAGLYPSDGDSIGIPLGSGCCWSLFAAILLAGGVRAAQPVPVGAPHADGGPGWGRPIAIVGTHLLAAGLLLLWGWAWSDPHHYPITAVCGLIAFAIVHNGARGLWATLARATPTPRDPPPVG